MLRKVMLAAIAGGMFLASSLAASADNGTSLSKQDRTFLQKAAQSNLAEIQSSRLALQRSKNPQIVNVAGRMIREHTAAQKELSSLARGLGRSLPTSPSPEQRELYRRLTGLSGALFEESYLRAQSVNHDAAIGLFQKQVSNGSNASLRGYAARYLPKVRSHATMVSKTANVLAINVPRPSQVATSGSGTPGPRIP